MRSAKPACSPSQESEPEKEPGPDDAEEPQPNLGDSDDDLEERVEFDAGGAVVGGDDDVL